MPYVMNVLAVNDEDEGRRLGEDIVSRLGARETMRLQILLLEALSRLSIGRHLTLVGGSALHGVYLHQRWSRTLDIEMPHAVAVRFREVACAEGLLLQESSEQARLTFTAPGKVFAKVQVSLNVFLRPSTACKAEQRVFSLASDHTAVIHAAPLAELLTMKLTMVSKRPRAVDYADLWLGLRGGEEVLQALRDLLQDPTWNRGSYTPPLPLRVAPVLQGLTRMQNHWEASLRPVLVPIPHWEQVKEDLTTWLVKLENGYG